eukprot:Sspe_Gene.101524::Locus_76110_Transcript_2_3_Confidence_0.500_Length_1670::g.101524::m.101524/K14209/SLC36A, PAT; solute carrier family 36 (proton-coupled amino acid transporter)
MPQGERTRRFTAPLVAIPSDDDPEWVQHGWAFASHPSTTTKTRPRTSRREAHYWRAQTEEGLLNYYHRFLSMTASLEIPFERGEISPIRPTAAEAGATVYQAFFLFLKSFVGGAILALPAAFAEGGLVAGTVAMVVISLWNFYCMYLLYQTGALVGVVNLGDLAEAAGGRLLRRTVEVSLFFTQCCFCVTYFIFFANCTAHAVEWFLYCTGPDLLSGWWAVALIALQVALFAPLVCLRRLQSMALPALLADALLFVCIAYLLVSYITRLSRRGVSPIAPLFLGRHLGVSTGTVMFAFEGVGMVLPVASTMYDHSQFPIVLMEACSVLLVLYTSFGALGCLAFGTAARPTVLVNLNEDTPSSPAPAILQLAWSLSILITFPIQITPAVTLLEHELAVPEGRNYARVALVAVLGAVAYTFQSTFDTFLSLAGVLCCLPMAVIYPPIFHFRLAAGTLAQAVIDITLLVLGCLMFVYILSTTLASLGNPLDPFPCIRT